MWVFFSSSCMNLFQRLQVDVLIVVSTLVGMGMNIVNINFRFLSHLMVRTTTSLSH